MSNAFTRRQLLQSTGVALFATMALAACSSTSSKDPHKITLWYAPDDPSVKAQKQWTQFNVTPFEKKNPGLTVNAVLVNGQTFDQKQKVALAAGTGPDIITTAGSSTAIPYATAGYLSDLGAASKANNWASTILPWALDMGYVNGKLVSLPTSYESLVLYYNKTLFDKHGWKVPTDRDALVELADEMKSAGVIPFAAGNASYQGATEWLVSSYFNQVAGPGKLHAALSGSIPWTDSAFEASIKMMKDDFDAGWYAGGVKQYFATQDPQKYAQFADGKSAMMVSGSWEMSTFPDYFGADGNKNEWAWASLPPLASGIPSGVFPLSVGGTISVNAHSSSKAASTKYIEWMFSDTANMWGNALATGAEPLPIPFQPSDVPSGIDTRYAAQYQAINEASEKGMVGYVTWTSLGAKSESYVLDHADKVVNGNLTPAQFCQGLDQAFAADKKAGQLPTLFETKA